MAGYTTSRKRFRSGVSKKPLRPTQQRIPRSLELKSGRSYFNRAGAQTVNVPNAGGIPEKLITKLIYNYSSTASATSTTPWYWTIKANSLYDPDYGNNIGNKQAMGRDRLSSCYSKYFVRFCTIVVDIMTSGATVDSSGTTIGTNGTGLQVNYFPLNNESSLLSATNRHSFPGSRVDMIAQNNHKRMVYRINCAKLADIDGPIGNVSGYSGLVGEDPTRVIYGQIEAFCPNAGSGVSQAFSYSIRIYQEVEYSRPKAEALNTQ